jgi:hypothetical protein
MSQTPQRRKQSWLHHRMVGVMDAEFITEVTVTRLSAKQSAGARSLNF